MGKEKMSEIIKHAERAVTPDIRRVWIGNRGHGLIFDCNFYGIQFDTPVGKYLPPPFPFPGKQVHGTQNVAPLPVDKTHSC